MTEQSQEKIQYEQVCKGAFNRLFSKLEQIDEAIRGNGKPGMLLRLDRLEQKGKLLWFVGGAAVTTTISAIVAWISRGGV